MEALPYILDFKDAYLDVPDVLYAIAEVYWLSGSSGRIVRKSHPTNFCLKHPEHAARDMDREWKKPQCG